MVTKIFKGILVLLNIVFLALVYYNDYYLKNNMAYYRTMFRFDQDFNDISLYFFLTIGAMIVIVSFVLKKLNSYKLSTIGLVIPILLFIVIYYLNIDSYLAISVRVIITSLITLTTFGLLCLTKQFKHRLILSTILYVVVFLILYI